MQFTNIINKFDKRYRYLIFGSLFGFTFPVIALCIDIFIMNELPLELDSIQYVHISNPINYIVDISPIMTGIFTFLLGISAEKITYYSRHLEDLVEIRTSELADSKRETDRVLDAVDEGLFVLQKDESGFVVGPRQSRSLARIFHGRPIGPGSFLEEISRFVPPKTSEQLSHYLELIGREKVKDRAVHDLNPLDRVEMTFSTDPTQPILRVLSFEFKRIDFTKDFLVRVKDITDSVRLEEQLKQNEAKSEEQQKMLLSILHVGPALLKDFMDGVDAEILIIDEALKAESAPEKYPELIETIFRSAHSIKGNAALIDMQILASAAHDLEDKLLPMRDAPDLHWNDFLPVAFQAAHLNELFNELKVLVSRIQNFHETIGDRTESATAMLPLRAAELTNRISAETGILVDLDFSRFDPDVIPNRYAYLMRDIIVQLIRNSLSHGIEKPEERLQAGKPERGTIEIWTERSEGGFELHYRDDGRSLQLEKIREKAVQMNRATEEESRQWDAPRLIRFIFEPGFSTASEQTMTAGRGMGMDIVRSRLKSAGGTLKVNYVPGHFVEFHFSFLSNVFEPATVD